ncbi:urease accessory protein UreF [Mycolicibacterium sp. Dal123E01]|uniref:urease accessory protein UreF n=1 Tax=Mycolicibacterium sp. Dal123E01 TaxID=3457578 RepID=UPI00403EDD88
MTTDPRALTAWLQLHDSALPAGRMVHSNGFEEWLARRPDAGQVEIENAVLDYLEFGYGPLDATVTAAAWRAAPAADALIDLDELLASYKLSSHARNASSAAGTQLLAAAGQIGLVGDHPYVTALVGGATPGHLAVVEGALQAWLGVDLHLAVLGSTRSVLASILSAAVRLGRLSSLAAQRIQHQNIDLITEVAAAACIRPLDDMSSTAAQIDIAGMQHEVRRQRLFAS